MTAKLPTPIKIGYKEVSLETISTEDAEKEGIYGKYESYNETISIQEGLKGPVLADTLVHELLHAIWNHQGTGDVQGLARHEEFLVNTLSTGLIQVLHDNPDLLTYITKNL